MLWMWMSWFPDRIGHAILRDANRSWVLTITRHRGDTAIPPLGRSLIKPSSGSLWDQWTPGGESTQNYYLGPAGFQP